MSHFNISAAVVHQLGEELVSDEVTALLELVKNSYDADADYVNIVVDTQARVYDNELSIPCPNGFITIEDNGTGMDLEDIERGWLVISVSNKREMKRKGLTTDRKKRTPMGDKGLGRLSTQRLGTVLNMVTSKGQPHKYVVSFDWKDFHEKSLLTQVQVSISQLIKPQDNHGTKLVITDLSDANAWIGDMRISVQNKLSQLISPFDDARAFQIYLTIDGTPIELAKIAGRVRQAAASTYKFEYESNKSLRISGRVKLNKLKVIRELDLYNKFLAADQGREFYNFITDPSTKYYVPDVQYEGLQSWFISFEKELDYTSIPELQYITFMGVPKLADPGSFYGEIDDFRLEPDDITDSIFDTKSEYKDFIKRLNGIRVFRDGFGIRPFGLDGNDWLKLGSNQTTGHSFYGLRPGNVLGYVGLRGGINNVLREKTDREGFVENEYSRNFFLIMSLVRDRINEVIESIRRSYNAYKDKRSGEDSGFSSQTFAQTIEGIKSTSQQAGRVERQIGEMLSEVEHTERALSQISDIVNRQTDSKQTGLSKALKTTEPDMRPAFAEMQRSLARANIIAKSTQDVLGKVKQLEEMAHVLGPKITRLEEQLEDFTDLASLGLTAEGFTHELETISDNLDARTSLVERNAKPVIGGSRELRTYLEYVRMSVSSIRRQLIHLAPSLKYVREKQELLSVRFLVTELAEFYRDNDPDVSFTIVEPFIDFTIFANKGRITQIIDNLVNNSIYWLKNHKKAHPDFRPEVSFSAYDQTLVIWDNGLGIDKTVESNLFQPFVTTKPRGVGRGLGLYIITQLLDTLNSEVILLPERNTHSRRFKFAVILKGAIKNG